MWSALFQTEFIVTLTFLTVQRSQPVHEALIKQSHVAMKTNESDIRQSPSYQQFLFALQIFYPELLIHQLAHDMVEIKLYLSPFWLAGEGHTISWLMLRGPGWVRVVTKLQISVWNDGTTGYSVRQSTVAALQAMHVIYWTFYLTISDKHYNSTWLAIELP